MKIFMVGEAATHRHQLLPALDTGLAGEVEIRPLPAEAAVAPDYDDDIAPDDVIISLRLRRDSGSMPPFALLHVPGAGLDKIDLAILSPSTTVCNVFEHEGPIAEFVVASLLNWEIRLDLLQRGFAPEAWPQVYRNRVPHGELAGKTIGIIGFGRIGRAIAARVLPFGVTVMAADAAAAPAEGVHVMPPSDLPRLLAHADYVVVACPLTEGTRGLIGHAELAAMKETAVLVNVSRAEVVAEAALFEALKSTRIRGASLDVWYRYPTGSHDVVPPADHPFHALPNVVCTPHSSAWTRELMDRRYARIAANISALAAGRPLDNVVRPGRP